MDWNSIINSLVSALLPAIGVILTAIASYVAIKIKNTLELKATDETKQMIAKKVVAYIDQTMKEAAGGDKFNNAIITASQWLAERKIDVSEIELKILIESAVNAARKEFGKIENNNIEIDNK